MRTDSPHCSPTLVLVSPPTYCTALTFWAKVVGLGSRLMAEFRLVEYSTNPT